MAYIQGLGNTATTIAFCLDGLDETWTGETRYVYWYVAIKDSDLDAWNSSIDYGEYIETSYIYDSPPSGGDCRLRHLKPDTEYYVKTVVQANGEVLSVLYGVASTGSSSAYIRFVSNTTDSITVAVNGLDEEWINDERYITWTVDDGAGTTLTQKEGNVSESQSYVLTGLEPGTMYTVTAEVGTSSIGQLVSITDVFSTLEEIITSPPVIEYFELNQGKQNGNPSTLIQCEFCISNFVYENTTYDIYTCQDGDSWILRDYGNVLGGNQAAEITVEEPGTHYVKLFVNSSGNAAEEVATIELLPPAEIEVKITKIRYGISAAELYWKCVSEEEVTELDSWNLYVRSGQYNEYVNATNIWSAALGFEEGKMIWRFFEEYNYNGYGVYDFYISVEKYGIEFKSEVLTVDISEVLIYKPDSVLFERKYKALKYIWTREDNWNDKQKPDSIYVDLMRKYDEKSFTYDPGEWLDEITFDDSFMNAGPLTAIDFGVTYNLYSSCEVLETYTIGDCIVEKGQVKYIGSTDYTSAPAPPEIKAECKDDLLHIAYGTSFITNWSSVVIELCDSDKNVINKFETINEDASNQNPSGECSFSGLNEGRYFVKARIYLTPSDSDEIIGSLTEANEEFVWVSIDIDSSKPTVWQWSQAAQNAFENNGDVNSVTHTEWNAFVEKVRDFAKYKKQIDVAIGSSVYGYSESTTYGELLDDAKMSDTEAGRTMTAKRFNLVRYVIGSACNTFNQSAYSAFEIYKHAVNNGGVGISRNWDLVKG